MTYDLELGFISDLDKKISMSIPRANKDVTAETIGAAMGRIIAANVVNLKNGEPKTADYAYLHTTDVEEFTYADLI